jgi:ribulose kinase
MLEQSGEAVWASVCDGVRSAVEAAGIDAKRISGIGFSAVSAVVALDESHAP